MQICNIYVMTNVKCQKQRSNTLFIKADIDDRGLDTKYVLQLYLWPAIYCCYLVIKAIL